MSGGAERAIGLLVDRGAVALTTSSLIDKASGDMQQRTTPWGSFEVPVLERSWRSGQKSPYRKTYSLKPGQSWFDAPVTQKQWEYYVEGVGDVPIPVGAAIVSELMADGAEQVFFVELWSGVVIVDHALSCCDCTGAVASLFDEIRRVNDGKLVGFPDVVAFFPDGRVVLREAKNLAKKDRLGIRQHMMADILRSLLGQRADLAVVHWDLVR